MTSVVINDALYNGLPTSYPSQKARNSARGFYDTLSSLKGMDPKKLATPGGRHNEFKYGRRNSLGLYLTLYGHMYTDIYTYMSI